MEIIKLGEVIKLSSGKGLTQDKIIPGNHFVYGGNGIIGSHNSYFIEDRNIVIGRVGAYCGSVHITEPKSWITDNGLYVTNFLKEIDLDYLALALSSVGLNKFAKVGGQPSISQDTVYSIEIPVPSNSDQKNIVNQSIEENKIIDSNKKLIEIMQKKIEEVLSEI